MTLCDATRRFQKTSVVLHGVIARYQADEESIRIKPKFFPDTLTGSRIGLECLAIKTVGNNYPVLRTVAASFMLLNTDIAVIHNRCGMAREPGSEPDYCGGASPLISQIVERLTNVPHQRRSSWRPTPRQSSHNV